MCETIAQCEYSPVLFLLEVGEDVGSSTRKEYFSWFTRVFAIQGLVQQRREIDILIHTHRFGRPTGDRITSRLRSRSKATAVKIL